MEDKKDIYQELLASIYTSKRVLFGKSKSPRTVVCFTDEAAKEMRDNHIYILYHTQLSGRVCTIMYAQLEGGGLRYGASVFNPKVPSGVARFNKDVFRDIAYRRFLNHAIVLPPPRNQPCYHREQLPKLLITYGVCKRHKSVKMPKSHNTECTSSTGDINIEAIPAERDIAVDAY